MAGLTCGGRALEAQSATAPISATVLSPIAVTGQRNMVFGNVTPGVPKTVPVNGAAAGRFDITGFRRQGVQISFTLPSSLASGVNALAIGSWTGLFNGANNQGGGATAFTPSASPQNATMSAAGRLHVWVGATVTPLALQQAGNYSANLTVTVVYQ